MIIWHSCTQWNHWNIESSSWWLVPLNLVSTQTEKNIICISLENFWRAKFNVDKGYMKTPGNAMSLFWVEIIIVHILFFLHIPLHIICIYVNALVYSPFPNLWLVRASQYLCMLISRVGESSKSYELLARASCIMHSKSTLILQSLLAN